MDQLKRAAQEAAEKLKEKMAKNPLEKALNEATSDVNWNASNKVLQEIADHTYSFGDFTEVMKHIWKRLGSERKAWRRILKTLSLIEYLIKNGSPRCIQEFRDEIYQIRTLQDFSHYEDGQDRGAATREVAKRVVQLLSEDQRIDEERKKAQEMRERLGEMRAFGSGGESKGGFSGGSGNRYGGYSSKEKEFGGSGSGSGYGGSGSGYGGSSYAGTGSTNTWKSTSEKGSHYDDDRKVGSWRVDKTAEEKPKESESHGGFTVKAGTKYEAQEERKPEPKTVEKPKTTVLAGPGGNKVLAPPKGSKITAPQTQTQAQPDLIDLMGSDPTPSTQPTTTQTNKIDPFNWNQPQTQPQTTQAQPDNQWDWGHQNGNTQQTTNTTQQNNTPFNWNQGTQNTAPTSNQSNGNVLQNLYQAQPQSQNQFGFPNQPQNQTPFNFNNAPTQSNMNNLTNQLGSLNFGGPQNNTGFNNNNNNQQGGFGFQNKPVQNTTSFPTQQTQNTAKNDGFEDFQIAKPTGGAQKEYKNYSQAEKSIIDLSDIASEATKKKDQKDKMNAAKNSNEGILYSSPEDLDNFFINPSHNSMGGGFNMQGGFNQGVGGFNQGPRNMGGMQQQQMGFQGGQMGGFGGQMNMGQGGFGGMNPNANFNPMGGNFQQGNFGNQNAMGGMNAGFGFR